MTDLENIGKQILRFSSELPEELTEREMDMANIILDTMLLGVMDLHEGYSDFIELEVI